MRPDGPTRCPVCRARAGAAATCSRCGADLSRLLQLLVEAHRARGAARQALAQADPRGACAAARRANELCATPSGARLEALLRWLTAVEGRGALA